MPTSLPSSTNGSERRNADGKLTAARCPRYHLPVPQSHRGKFLTFEGLDGTGKSTQIAKLAKALRVRGLPVVVTREPGGTGTGEKIRDVILHSATTGLSPMAEMALMFASRAQHIHEVILPALAAGKVVICDRFTDSTEAYQGGGRKLGSRPVLELHRILCADLQPDLTILLENDLATSLERARRRNQGQAAKKSHKDENRFEQETRAFFGRVRHTYLTIARRDSGRVVMVEAKGTPSQTHAKILDLVRKRLKLANRLPA
jgi:dTMP kinase